MFYLFIYLFLGKSKDSCYYQKKKSKKKNLKIHFYLFPFINFIECFDLANIIKCKVHFHGDSNLLIKSTINRLV